MSKELLWGALAVGGVYAYFKLRDKVRMADQVLTATNGIVHDVRTITSSVAGATAGVRDFLGGISRVTNAGRELADGFGDLLNLSASGQSEPQSIFDRFF